MAFQHTLSCLAFAAAQTLFASAQAQVYEVKATEGARKNSVASAAGIISFR